MSGNGPMGVSPPRAHVLLLIAKRRGIGWKENFSQNGLLADREKEGQRME